MANAKERVAEFSKGKDTKSYAGGLTGLASKVVEKIGNTASKAKAFAKKHPDLCLVAAVVSTVAVAPVLVTSALAAGAGGVAAGIGISAGAITAFGVAELIGRDVR